MLYQLANHLEKVKLLALDVDGILTDGGLYYTETGQELKKFNVKDGLGIKQLIKNGIEVAIISASSSESTRHRATKLGIRHVFIGCDEKLLVLKDLCQTLQIDLSQVAYMGDDLTDLPVLKAVGCPLTVADAIAENRACAIHVTEKGGGQGAVRDICDLILASIKTH
ncbi:MAG: HAD-IIIA family hydrolase [Leptolyngbya sp. SIO3F4]|nr:HAD-IIIA family hydrolase [Leptolyngbya sp. SIO3F4]